MLRYQSVTTNESCSQLDLRSVGQTRVRWLATRFAEVISTDAHLQFAASVILTCDNRGFGFELADDATGESSGREDRTT